MLAVLLAASKKKGVSTSNAVDAYSKGGQSGLSSGSFLVLVSGTLKHFTFTFFTFIQLWSSESSTSDCTKLNSTAGRTKQVSLKQSRPAKEESPPAQTKTGWS